MDRHYHQFSKQHYNNTHKFENYFLQNNIAYT